MRFTQKLQRLTEGKNRAEIARRVGLKPTVLSDYVREGYAPRADIALKMARALDVPLEWLVDDDQDWPPPAASSVAMTTEQLAAELGRRLLPVGLVMLEKIQEAQKVDWEAVAAELINADPTAPLPKPLRDVILLPGQITALASELRRYDPGAPVGEAAPPAVLREVKPEFEIGLLDLWNWHRNLEDRPGFLPASNLAVVWLMPDAWRPPWFAESVKFAREKAAADLKGTGLRLNRKTDE